VTVGQRFSQFPILLESEIDPIVGRGLWATLYGRSGALSPGASRNCMLP